IAAIDQRQVPSDIKIAVGDRVRLFRRTNARYSDYSRGYFGDNGTTADVVSIDEEGVRLRRADGQVGAIRWASLQDEDTGRVLLSYGHAQTIDARQGATLTDHITLMPGGSAAVNGFKAYPADTRNREDSVFIVSHGAEKEEVRGRRPLGDPWVATASEADMRAAILDNIGRNLARKPEKVLATDFLEGASEVHEGALRSQRAVWFRTQAAADEPGPTPSPVEDPPDTGAPAAPAAPPGAPLVLKGPKQAQPPAHAPTTAAERDKQARAAKRSVRPPAQRPKKAKEKPMEAHEAQAEFADALRTAGLIVKGPPVMDGRWHRAGVEGKAASNKSARYRGHLDGRPAGWITNYVTGYDKVWNASRAPGKLTAEDRRAMEARQNQREAEKLAGRLKAGKRAYAIWQSSKPARVHPYLERKGVAAHGMRVDNEGNLVVPMRDAAGYLHNVQRIPADPAGKKLFLGNGVVEGMFATLGEPKGDKPILIGEGFATVATLREATGFSAVVAFNSGNLMAVAQAFRAKFPDAPIIFAADNDHHLPRQEKPLPNVGKEKAEAAAKEVGGIVLLPTFREADEGSDWNDWKALHGAEALAAVLETRLAKEGLKMDLSKEAGRTTQAQRDAARTAQRGKAAEQGKQQAQEAAQRAATTAALRQAANEQRRQRDNGKGL
ncbi:MAG: hypothetical protein JWP57_4388, partial [Spirosoma sp.]|nr:hypothetical protein [Spirosoma sp.]